MGWFEHRHHWYSATDLNKVMDRESNRAIAVIILEKCSCGDVRTIEFSPGQNPVIRYADLAK